jgi:ActR/RegA family two-component response regulator
VFPAVRPDVVLTDLNLGNNTSGVDATRAIATALPSTKVLVLSTSGEHSNVLEAVKAGASGYLATARLVAKGTTARQIAEAGALPPDGRKPCAVNAVRAQLHNRVERARYAIGARPRRRVR